MLNFQKFQRISPDLADAPEDLQKAIQKNIPFVFFVSFCSNSQKKMKGTKGESKPHLNP
jgi:hypothetical protein